MTHADFRIEEFQIGFWHPFGAHSKESPEEILKRKEEEIEKNGWTLWSFQHRAMLDVWCKHLKLAEANRVFIYYSMPNGKEPGGKRECCRSYRYCGEINWRPMPDKIKVPHSFQDDSKRQEASAFKVKQIFHPVPGASFKLPPVQWFRKDGIWCETYDQGRKRGIPTHGEFLIRPGGTTSRRPVGPILELMSPYLAVVGTKLAEGEASS